MSEELRKAICTLLTFLEVIAKQTKNPVDDVIVEAAKAVLGCEV